MKRRKLLTLSGDTLQYGVVVALGQSASLLLLPVYTRVLTPEEYGMLDIILLGAGLVSLVVGLQVDSGIARFYYELPVTRRPELVFTGVVLIGGGIFLIIPGLLISRHWLSQVLFNSKEYASTIALALVLVCASQFKSFLLLILRLQRAKWRYGFAAVWDVLVMAGANILLVVKFRMGATGAVLGTALGSVTTAILTWAMLYGSIKCRFLRSTARDILRYSLPIVPATISNWAQSYLDRFILKALLGIAAVGIYGVGVRIGSMLMLVVAAFRLGWVPYVMESMHQPDHKEVVSHVLSYYMAIMVVLGSGVMLFSADLVNLLAGTAYHGATSVVPWLVAVTVINAILLIVSSGLWVVKKTYLNTLSLMTGTLVDILLLLVFVPRWGLSGAGAAWLIASLTTLILNWWMANANYPTPYNMGLVSAMGLLFLGGSVVAHYLGRLDTMSLRLGIQCIVLAGIAVSSVALITSKEDRRATWHYFRQRMLRGE